MIRSWGDGEVGQAAMKRCEKKKEKKKILGSFLMSLPFDSVSLPRYVNDSGSVRVEVSVRHVDV